MPQQRPPPHRYRGGGGSSANIAIDAVIIASSYMPLATNDFMVLAGVGSCVIGHVAKTVQLTDLDRAREAVNSLRAVYLRDRYIITARRTKRVVNSFLFCHARRCRG